MAEGHSDTACCLVGTSELNADSINITTNETANSKIVNETNASASLAPTP